MPGPLAISTGGALDFLSLGVVVVRLDPGVVPFRKARQATIHVSGGEYNVAANLADCFGLRTGIATAMVNYPIGELVDERIRSTGVRPIYRRFEHDGVRGPNIATVYSDRGYGVRAPLVFYNRSDEAAFGSRASIGGVVAEPPRTRPPEGPYGRTSSAADMQAARLGG
jgi:2-dehydro-3-deoxygluconokinase